jgi:hypothetical protein
MGNTGLGLSLPGVEKAMLEMEGSGLTGEELREKFARLGRRVCLPISLFVNFVLICQETTKTATGPLSPTAPSTPGAPAPAVPNEALHNFVSCVSSLMKGAGLMSSFKVYLPIRARLRLPQKTKTKQRLRLRLPRLRNVSRHHELMQGAETS